MRIGEVKKIIRESLDESNKIVLKSEPIYGGQGYRVSNYAEVFSALKLISKERWNDADFKPIDKIFEEHPIAKRVDLSAEQFNQLTSYVNTVNQKTPLYFLILDSLVKDQDEYVLNIQLPEKIKSLNDLNIFNERLIEIFSDFNNSVGGTIEFKGFDEGTLWYVIGVAGVTYPFIIACLKVSQEFLKVRKEYFNSQEAKVGYMTALQNYQAEDSPERLREYQEVWLDNFLREKVREVVVEIDNLHGRTEEEMCSHLVRATTKLITELDEGTEFHLSLNPPEYAKEKGGEFKIDYVKIKASQPKEEPGQLPAPGLPSEEGV